MLKRTNHFKPVILLVMLFTGILSTKAHDFEFGGIYYNLEGNEAIVTFRGTYSAEYNEYFGDVTIPATVTYNGTTYPVTAIGGMAFYECRDLTRVSLPNSVDSIAYNSFYGCSGLTSITIPSSVTYMEDFSFAKCSSLKTLYYNAKNCEDMNWGWRVFWNSPIESVIIGEGVEKIPAEFLEECSNVQSLVIPNSVTYIGAGAFDDTEWYNNQPDGLVYAGLIAYKYKGSMPNGTMITFKSGTIGIASSAFYDCSDLAGITIPNSVTTIGCYTFWNCTGLTSVIIPNSVSFIGEDAFERCRGLTNVVLSNSLSSLEYRVFMECTSLKHITIPNSVTHIEQAAFSGCTGLTSVDIPNSVTVIGRAAFANCYSLNNVIIPNSVTRIRDSAFSDCSGLTNLVIGESVAIIEPLAFDGCSSLKSITIPKSVTEIGQEAFASCSGLINITCLADTPPQTDIAIFYRDCYDNATLYVPINSIVAYKAAFIWGHFSHIVGISTNSGDVNIDGEINISDINAVIDIILSGIINLSGDVNRDGEVNISDVNTIIDIILSL